MSKKRILFRSGLLTLSLVCSFLIRGVDAENLFLINGPLTADSINSCNLSANGEELYCIDMGITGIEPGAFVNFPNLKNLYLSDNNIYDLYGGEFEGLDNLEHLNLENNDISELYPESFDGIRSTLKRLYLFNAGITNIDSEAFSGMKNLELLNLDSNRIKYLSVNTFKGLDNLQELSLIGNYEIVCYPMGLFSGMDNVKLGKDKLASCLTYENILDVCGWDGVTQTLDCSNKDIEFIPEYAFEVVDGAETSDPTEYHPKNVVNLNLSGNRIEYMALNSLYGLEDLEYLNLRGNPLGCYPDFNGENEEDNEGGNDGIIIEADEGVTPCFELNRDNVFSICNVSYSSDNSSFYVVDCSNKGITNIAAGTFGCGWEYIDGQYRLLSSILLNNNEIFHIEPHSFDGVCLLGYDDNVLDLSNNKLTKLDIGTFIGFSIGDNCRAGSSFIYLNNNQISEIVPGAFAGLSMVAERYNHIYLNNNKLSHVDERTFAGIDTHKCEHMCMN